MAISDHLTVETNSISALESEKRSHQQLKRPRVFEKIEAHNSDTLNGSISPIHDKGLNKENRKEGSQSSDGISRLQEVIRGG